MTMTTAELKAELEKREAQARVTAEEMKAKRDKFREQADKAHKEYIAFCDANGIPVKGKRAKS